VLTVGTRWVVDRTIALSSPIEFSAGAPGGRRSTRPMVGTSGCVVVYDLVAIGCSFRACSFFFPLLLRFQVCRARSCAMLAGPFYSTREARPASAAPFARPSPPCRHQVRTGCLVGFPFDCLLLWNWDAAIIAVDSLNLCIAN